MNIDAGFKFVLFLITLGILNYLTMLARYESDLNKIKMIKKIKYLNYTQKVPLLESK